MLKKRRRISWDEYCRSLDVETVELHPAVKKDDPYEKGYCDGFIKAWNTQAEMKERTCRDDGDPCDFCCSECGARMFTDVNDTYTMIANDEQTIIKHPNYCPNCGAKVVE